MPTQRGALTAAEKTFAAAYATTGDSAYSAQRAGYRTTAGGSMALARPAIQAEIVRLQTEKLFATILPLAIEQHEKLLRNDATPAGAKVQAIKLAYDRTLGLGEGGEAKEPHEMTAEELDAAIQKLRRAAADRAKPVIEHDPDPGVFD